MRDLRRPAPGPARDRRAAGVHVRASAQPRRGTGRGGRSTPAAAEAAASAPARPQGAAPAARSVQREGRGHLPRVPRRRDTRATPARRSSRASMRIATTSARRSAPAACNARPATAPAPGTHAARTLHSINSLKAELDPNGAGAQPAVPRLPPGGRAHRLACQRARAQRPRLRRLPPDPPGPRRRCSPRPASPTSASPATGKSAPISRSLPPTRCASA